MIVPRTSHCIIQGWLGIQLFSGSLSRVPPVGEGLLQGVKDVHQGGRWLQHWANRKQHTNPRKLSTGDKHPAFDNADLHLEYPEGTKTLKCMVLGQNI